MAPPSLERPSLRELVKALHPILACGLPLAGKEESGALDTIRALCPKLDSEDPEQRVDQFNKFLLDDLQHFEDRELGDAAIVLFTVRFGNSSRPKDDLESRRRAAATLLDMDICEFPAAQARILEIIAWHIQIKQWVQDEKRRLLPLFGWRAMICLLATLPFLGLGSFSIDSSIPSWLFRGFFATLAIVGATTYARRRYGESLRKSTFQRELGKDVDYLPDWIARSLQGRAARELQISALQAEIFALAITRPSSLRSRIVENYEPRQRTLYQRVSINIQLPQSIIKPPKGDESGNEAEVQTPTHFRVPFPVVVLPKGELNDNLRFWSADDSLIPTLSHSEYLQLVASVLRMIMLKAYQALDVSNNNEIQLPREAKAAERTALLCIMQRGRHRPRRRYAPTGDFPNGVILDGSVERAIEGLLDLKLPDPNEYRSLQLAAELVRKLSNHYAVVASVECDGDGRAIFGYERTILPELNLAHRVEGDRLRWLKDRLALSLGARPIELSLPIDNAATCQSFHLFAHCPEGLYLRKQKLCGIDRYIQHASRQPTKMPVRHGIPPYYRVRQRLGQAYAHFYARFFPEPTEGSSVHAAGGDFVTQANLTNGDGGHTGQARGKTVEIPKFKVYFLEVPPGSIFRAAVTAASCAILVTIIGLVISRAGNAGTDVPAFLLAFPAIAAAWLGFDAPSQRLLEGTLLARLSLLCSAIVAIMASGLFMVYNTKSHLLRGSMPFPIHVTFFGIEDTSWGVLAACATMNAVYVTYKYLIRTWEYKQLSTRNPTSAQDIPRLDDDKLTSTPLVTTITGPTKESDQQKING